jgi:hypothetical protein
MMQTLLHNELANRHAFEKSVVRLSSKLAGQRDWTRSLG